ncbi:uncharacterized protein LOC131597247 [Vicia villosa]|uniref:uncharacterized protein LOC131597247 n=1 Tax=Vicia villosa TaxID=3911 RepID=UPI00273BE97C|nr:uncharacterized protein LOC131597247 [Vicia villosa]
MTNQQQGLSHYNQGYQSEPSELEETMNQFMQLSLSIQQNRETRDVQLTQFLTEQNVSQIPTFQNPTTCVETCNVTSIKSAKVLDEEVENKDVEKEDDNRGAEDEEDEIVVTEVNKEVKKRDQSKRKKACDKMASKVIPSQHLPYPHAPSKKDNARQHARFMDIFKQLRINIPFAEALEQMPKYAKFMKKIITKKKKHTDEETVLLDAQCSAVIQRTTPRKEADPGRVTLPLNIGGNFTGDGLIDLGSSINLIPLSIVKKLGNIVTKPTRMTLQLADKSITSPYGVVQDLLTGLIEQEQKPKKNAAPRRETSYRGATRWQKLSRVAEDLRATR